MYRKRVRKKTKKDSDIYTQYPSYLSARKCVFARMRYELIFTRLKRALFLEIYFALLHWCWWWWCLTQQIPTYSIQNASYTARLCSLPIRNVYTCERTFTKIFYNNV